MLETEIQKGEGERLEFKRDLNNEPLKWLKTVVAFANGRGGRVLFGVDDDRTVIGVDDVFATRDAIADMIANRCAPMVPVNIETTTIGDKPVIVVEVLQGKACPYYIKSKGDTNGVYIRYDATTRQADENILQELRIDGAGKSFDRLVCRGLTITERDIEKLCRKMRTVARRNAKNDEQRRAVKPLTKMQLIKWGVLVECGGELLPTWAYVLLSGNSRLSPVVKCGVFKGKDRAVFVDRREFDTPVQDQVESAVQYVLAKINMGARFNGVYREDVYEIPPDAIRELIVNAIVHRQYIDAEASPITIALYDDRLEVTSPGGLVRGMTLTKMLNGYSDCRNKALASAFAYMNLIENWGSGIKRTFKEFRAAGLRDPEFIVWPNAIRINVYRAGNNEVNIVPIGTNVDNRDGNDSNFEGVNIGTNGTNVGTNDTNSAEEIIISCVSKNLSITLESLAECCKMSRRSVARTIKTLKNQGRIRRIGGTRGHWEVLK